MKKIVKRFRDPKTGRFAKFSSNRNLVAEIYSFDNKKMSTSIPKRHKKKRGFTGIIATENGKRVKVTQGQSVDTGFVYFDGVLIFRLKSNSILEKSQITVIKEYLANLKQGKKTFNLQELFFEDDAEQINALLENALAENDMDTLAFILYGVIPGGGDFAGAAGYKETGNDNAEDEFDFDLF